MKKTCMYIFIILIIIVFTSACGNTPPPVETPEIIMEEDISLSMHNVTLDVGESVYVNAYVLPTNATYQKLTWTSINSNVASVNNGLITGLSPGKSMIHVATEKKKLFKIISVTVNDMIIEVKRIIINNPSIELYIGEKERIHYRIEPYDATDKKVSFISDNPNIATVNEKNEVVALNQGQTTINVKAHNGVTEKINVNIKKKIVDVTSISLNKTSIMFNNSGKSDILTANITPSNATDKTVVWKSSNPKVATVDANGKVTSIGEGSATITATSNGNYLLKATCNVIVSIPQQIEVEVYERPITQYSSFADYGNIASCVSNSLIYRIININGNDWVLAWVKNPAKQLNNALANGAGTGKASAESILENEISNYGYQNKCLVAANASFFNMSSGNVLSDIVISKGKVVKNTGNASCLGVTRDGKLKEYIGQPVASFISDGVMSTFGHSNSLSPKNYKDVDKTNRTVICQVNKNNFVLVSGSGVPEKIAYDVNRMTGGAACYNLDGGGSRKLYYKSQGSSIIKRFGGSRAIPDMIYFVEQ